MNDPFNLARFVEAQAAVYPQVRAELRAGEKRSHWIWFVFPQIKGLGHSPTAVHFSIDSLEEAAAFARHPVLGPRLVECTQLVNRVDGRTIGQIFGFPDELKFRSSMTLFARVVQGPSVFAIALKKYFDGNPDQRTVELLG